MEIFLLLILLPLVRCLWYAGTWFKRHSRLEYEEE